MGPTKFWSKNWFIKWNRWVQSQLLTIIFLKFIYTKLPHDKLVDKLSSIIGFAFRGSNKSYIRISRNGKTFWGKKIKVGIGFSKAALQAAVTFLMENS